MCCESISFVLCAHVSKEAYLLAIAKTTEKETHRIFTIYFEKDGRELVLVYANVGKQQSFRLINEFYKYRRQFQQDK